MIKFLDLKAQYDQISDNINLAISDVINNSAFVGGEKVCEFEDEFARYVGVEKCVGVGNGTDALEIALKSFNFEPGSQIILPANSFIATSEAVTNAGYSVIFCDICPENCNIDLDDLEKKITRFTKAIILVHLYGMPGPVEGVIELGKKYNLKIIEDCAQAHGARVNGRHVGSFGDAATFSFYPGKNLGAYGDAGAIVTNNIDVADTCRQIANHGRVSKYDHDFEGRNSRLDGIQAAILLVKLKYLEAWIDRRREIAKIYQKHLPDEILTQKIIGNIEHAYHLFVIKVNDREFLRSFLMDNNVETGIHYPIALPDLKAYSNLGQKGKYINATINASKVLSLPIGEHMNDEDAYYVSSFVNKWLEVGKFPQH